MLKNYRNPSDRYKLFKLIFSKSEFEFVGVLYPRGKLEKINLLIFSDATANIQHVFAIDYFQRLHLYCTESGKHFEFKSKKIRLKYSDFLNAVDKVFSGDFHKITMEKISPIIATHRPYHYFVDFVFGAYCGLLEFNIKKIFEHSSYSAFIDLDCFFKYQRIDCDVVQIHLNYKIDDGFPLLLTLNPKRHKIDDFENCKLFENFTAYKEDLVKYSVHAGLNSFKQNATICSDINLWFGITNQKRLYIQQVDLVDSIVRQLLRKKDVSCISLVIDGWTSPLNKTERDQVSIEQDMIVYNNIYHSLRDLIDSKSVLISNTIGSIAVDKIATLQKCDFAITNAGAGALFASLICDIPTFAHTSNKMRELHSRIHLGENSYLVPEDIVFDIEDKKASDQISYNIDPEIYSLLILECLADNHIGI